MTELEKILAELEEAQHLAEQAQLDAEEEERENSLFLQEPVSDWFSGIDFDWEEEGDLSFSYFSPN